MYLRHLFSALIAATLALSASADVKLAGLFSDHMVLQRGQAVPVWGWAEPGETVTVTFADQSTSHATGPDGRWSVELAAMDASVQGRVLSVSSDQSDTTLSVTNVVVGDVWICSGQSNMEWSLGRSSGGAEDAKTNYPLIRHFKIAHIVSPTPNADVTSTWVPATRGSAKNFTAVGFYFARDIHQTHGVPIGLIGSNWGGTRIEPWTAPVGIRQVPELVDLNAQLSLRDPKSEAWLTAQTEYLAAMGTWMEHAEAAVAERTPLPAQPKNNQVTWSGHRDPTMIYNAMIAPLVPFAIKGAIWYQGESNGGEGQSYRWKTHALIKGWRALWGYEFPFYTVQLADYKADSKQPAGGDGWAKLREAQLQALEIPKTGMACIIDIGNARNIHPGNKRDVGKRLARWARAHDYGETELVPSGPLYASHRVEEGAVVIEFDHVGAGLMVGSKNNMEPTVETPDAALARFSIAGADKTWVWADAVIKGDTVVVSSPEVAEPVAVRYGFTMNPVGANLYNRDGLPASPFRTDAW